MNGKGFKNSSYGALLIAGLIVATIVFCVVITVCWDFLIKHHEELRNLFIVLAAMVGLPLVIWRTNALDKSAKAAEKQSAIAADANITDRFTKAIEHLGSSDKLDVRLGGIYALEKLVQQYSEYHPQIMEVLTATVRANTQKQSPKEADPETGDKRKEVKPTIDIQVILTVLSRRQTSFDKGRLDLQECNLEGADLGDAHLEGAYLRGAHLEGADLGDAHLEKAYLRGAHLEKADLRGAHLEWAYLMDAHLEGADLRGAHLEGIKNLACEQLRAAENWNMAYRDKNHACGEPMPDE
jgi:hypothetical protein